MHSLYRVAVRTTPNSLSEIPSCSLDEVLIPLRLVATGLWPGSRLESGQKQERQERQVRGASSPSTLRCQVYGIYIISGPVNTTADFGFCFLFFETEFHSRSGWCAVV